MFGAYHPNVDPNIGNCYVEDMTHHTAIDATGEVSFTIVDPVVDAAVLIALSAYTALQEKTMKVKLSEPFGRTLLVNHSVACDVYVRGSDYLGQPMTETVVVATGGTAVQGNKAFKYITSITAEDAGNVTISAGNRYGLPFVGVELVREVIDGIAATEGTVTVPPTSAQTATSVDPRGLYNPNEATNGAKDVTVVYVTTDAQTGGLYGQRHFAA